MYSVAWSDDGKFLLLNMGKQYHGEIKFVAWGIGSFLAVVPETDEILLIDVGVKSLTADRQLSLDEREKIDEAIRVLLDHKRKPYERGQHCF